VHDSEKARELVPKDLYTRRTLCDTGYYVKFNRENMDIVGIAQNPILSVGGGP